MPELQLGIFASYALKKEEILRILKMARRENGVNETGLGSRKATTFKAWAVRSGLIDKKTGHLTPQGQIVLAYDPQLQSSVTDWLMHFYLSFGDNGLATPQQMPPSGAVGHGLFISSCQRIPVLFELILRSLPVIFTKPKRKKLKTL